MLQVITNMLANAFRWTPDGGRIELAADAPDGLVRVAVTDTGPGISDDERERIFTPFISRDNHGTGLGLPISASIIRAHGGRIAARNRAGGGTTFRVTLPVEDGKKDAA